MRPNAFFMYYFAQCLWSVRPQSSKWGNVVVLGCWHWSETFIYNDRFIKSSVHGPRWCPHGAEESTVVSTSMFAGDNALSLSMQPLPALQFSLLRPSWVQLSSSSLAWSEKQLCCQEFQPATLVPLCSSNWLKIWLGSSILKVETWMKLLGRLLEKNRSFSVSGW